jgi:predicted ATPase/class 3 adenylate cyclase
LVTFVVTDIEGSTRLFRRLGDAYPPLLDMHNALLRDKWNAFGGAEVKTVGDSFIVAFESALDAMTASVAAQRAVAEHPWPTDGVIRIRVGVHTGSAYPRDGDYVALALHQAARVVGAANGGQVIASDDAVEAIGEALGNAPAVRVEPLGTFRLRDFERPVQLAAVLSADAPSAGTVTIRATPAERHNLVVAPTSFVGRSPDVDAIERIVRPGHLVTLAGAGGMGKTRLALEVGVRLAPEWPDGVWFVDLSPVSDERLVVTAVGEAIGLATGELTHAEVIGALEHRRSLLIMDNCEHVIEAAARFVGALLGRSPGVGVLATSRVPLGIQAEEVWRIGGLAAMDDAVRLFVERAAARAPDYRFDAADLETVADICRHVDGMPLAIELAAARITVLSPQEILDGLERRFGLLRTNDRTTPARLRSSGALLDWGQALLSTAEQAVFRRLGVYRGSFDLGTAEASAGFGEVDPDEVTEAVWSLTDQSLLTVERTSGHTRYRMLETVRVYALDRLAESGESAAVRARLAEHYLWRFPWRSISSKAVLGELALEVDTIGPLVGNLLDDARSDEALALARLLSIARYAEGRLALAVEELTQTIRRADPAASMLARAHVGVVHIATMLGQVERAEEHLRGARRAVVLNGPVDRWGRVSLARAESDIALHGADRAALVLAEDLLERELADPLSDQERADLLSNLGEVMGELDHPATIDTLAESIALARSIGDDGQVCGGLCSLAEHELRRGDAASAARHQLEALRLAADMGAPVAVASSFILAARLGEAAGFGEAALRMHGAADVLLEQAGFTLYPSDQALSDEMRQRVRRQLDDARCDALTAEGRQLGLHPAIELAEQLLGHTVASGINAS